MCNGLNACQETFIQLQSLSGFIMMSSKIKFWITLSLCNLCITSLLGMILRTKFLFPIPFLDYKNFLSAHTHFAFGGWITLTFMVLFIASLLTPEQAAKKIYQFILWGIEITAMGMAVSFPFDGYALVSILFSTLFIFFTYAFSWVFIKDFIKTKRERPVPLLAIAALSSLVLSSAGPFTLAYILATGSGDAVLYHDAIYTFLHFQYNGFFTLSVFTLFIHMILPSMEPGIKKSIRRFSLFLIISIPPALFLSLSWHPKGLLIHIVSATGSILMLAALFFFFRFVSSFKRIIIFKSRFARMLLIFSMVSFCIKILLQISTIIPELAYTVFGFRPIIIGFLHLVFLGLVTFYILAHLVERGEFNLRHSFTKNSLIAFSGAIILNELILLVQGFGLLLSVSNNIYGWLLWIASILLFFGSLFIYLARFQINNFKSEIPD